MPQGVFAPAKKWKPAVTKRFAFKGQGAHGKRRAEKYDFEILDPAYKGRVTWFPSMMLPILLPKRDT